MTTNRDFADIFSQRDVACGNCSHLFLIEKPRDLDGYKILSFMNHVLILTLTRSCTVPNETGSCFLFRTILINSKHTKRCLLELETYFVISSFPSSL